MFVECFYVKKCDGSCFAGGADAYRLFQQYCQFSQKQFEFR